jgi:hypothetical protein
MYLNKKHKLQHLALALCALVANFTTLRAQQPQAIKTTVSATTIRIGEQVVLTLHVPIHAKDKLQLTKYTDTINTHISVANMLVDTVKAGAVDTLHVKYFITSFDSGYWAIPPIPLVVNKDTLYSDIHLLTVNTVAVDTTKDIKAIKPPMDAPFAWKEILPYVIGAWLIAFITTLIVVLYRKYFKKEKQPETPVIPLTPHEWAMQQLTAIDAQQLWQQGFTKEYHSGIADTLREYLYKEFKFNALEQTTAQTKRSIKHITAISHDNKRRLIDVLELADMVKFAKETPIQDEHEASLRYAKTFIDGVNTTLMNERNGAALDRAE